MNKDWIDTESIIMAVDEKSDLVDIIKSYSDNVIKYGAVDFVRWYNDCY